MAGVQFYVTFWMSVLVAILIVAVLPMLGLQLLMLKQLEDLVKHMRELVTSVKALDVSLHPTLFDEPSERTAENPLDQFASEVNRESEGRPASGACASETAGRSRPGEAGRD